MGHKNTLHKATPAGLLIALGIIYGDIGTSPLYVMQAIIGKNVISEDTVLGALSCIFWTLTLQTTLKYVILILRADNRGEGGIFALYALVRRHARWLTIPAIIGGSTLLADGIITPPISVASAVEGLRVLKPDIDTVPIILVILTILFLFQIMGTNVVGKAFGPLMMIWFTLLGTLGFFWVIKNPMVIKALSPVYAYNLLFERPEGFWQLGNIFLCTTGAEALYSDLGHCGRNNIRISWVFVKICLLLNYLGQGAWLIAHQGTTLGVLKPFFALMPDWFLVWGVFIAAIAAVIASQALISGSFTLISEAIRLNFWPKVVVNYPSEEKGQLYIPSVNLLLYVGCVCVVLYFKESSNMEAAYGLAITMTMLMTTLLTTYYLYTKRFFFGGVLIFTITYVLIEGAFLVANLSKFSHGGWVSLLIGGLIMGIMWTWYRASIIKNRLTEYVKLEKYIKPLKEMSHDEAFPKYATHLIYMSNAARRDEIEQKIIYSIFEKRPKRADIYWFVHVEMMDNPYQMDYTVDTIVRDDIYKITFKLGFRVPQKIHAYFKTVLEELVEKGEINIENQRESLMNKYSEFNPLGDFRFVVLEKFLSNENSLTFIEKLVMEAYFTVKGFTSSEDKWFGLDSSSVKLEKVPLVIRPLEKVNLKRTL